MRWHAEISVDACINVTSTSQINKTFLYKTYNVQNMHRRNLIDNPTSCLG